MLRDFVTQNRDEIIARCREKTAKRGPMPSGPVSSIDYGVPMFLDELVDELRLKPLPNPEIGKSASQHGHDLQRQGFSVSQVVHGYGDVCQAITEMAVERRATIGADDFRLLNRALDDAIAAAVTQYGQERDQFIEGETEDETDRLAVMAHQLGRSIRTARSALDAIRSGRVGIAGSTGTVLDRSLSDANLVVDRLLSADVFAGRPRAKGRATTSA